MGVLINTSFNVRGEPIVNSPTDAFKCFMNTEMDYLVIENYLYSKKDQKIKFKRLSLKRIKLVLINAFVFAILLIFVDPIIKSDFALIPETTRSIVLRNFIQI